MSQTNLCRLCVHQLYQDSKSLYDENGFGNELYEITFKYFHPTIVNMDKWKDLTSICLMCWRSIWDFHNFQNSVQAAQSKLLETKEKVSVKTENSFDFAQEFQHPVKSYAGEIKIEGDFISLPEMEALEAGGQSSFNSADLQSQAGNRKFKKPSSSSPSATKIQTNFISLPEFELVDVHSDNEGCSDNDDLPSTSRTKLSKDNEDSEIVMLSDDSDEDKVGYDDATMLSYHFGSDDDEYENKPVRHKRKTKSQEDDIYFDWNAGSSDEGTDIRTNTTRAERNEELDDLMAKWMPNLKCKICSRSCNSWTMLQDHYRQKHPKEDCYIMCCGRKLREHWTLKEHLRFHNNPSIFKCKTCGKCHSTKCSLKRHIDAHHPEIQPIKCICKLCGKGFTTMSGLNYHTTTVHDAIPQPERVTRPDGSVMYHCRECGKQLASATSARQHVWYNHRHRTKYPCKICGKSFRQPRQIREHMAAHTGKQLYACAYCPTTFTYFNSLQVHRKAKHPTQNDENFYTMLEDN